MYTVDDGIEVMATQFVSESFFLLERFLDKINIVGNACSKPFNVN